MVCSLGAGLEFCDLGLARMALTIIIIIIITNRFV